MSASCRPCFLDLSTCCQWTVHCRIKSRLILFMTVRPCVCLNCFTFWVCASNTKRSWTIIPFWDKTNHFALFGYNMVFKSWEAFFAKCIWSSLSPSALINLTAFLFTGTFGFGHFPLFTWWCLVICQKNAQLYNHLPNHFQCKATVWDNVQGIATLVGRCLGKTLTIDH